MREKRRDVVAEARRWVVENEGRSAMAPFTGQDASAFAAWVCLLELYARCQAERPRAVEAMAAVVRCAQPSVRDTFKRAIPWALDWADEDRLWAEIMGGAPAIRESLRTGES